MLISNIFSLNTMVFNVFLAYLEATLYPVMPLLRETLRIEHFVQKYLHLPRCIDRSASHRKYLPLFKSHSFHISISLYPPYTSLVAIRSNASRNHIVSIFFSTHFSSPNPDAFFFVLPSTSRKGENGIGQKSQRKAALQFHSRGMLQL